MIQEEIKDRELIETWLTSKRGQKVTVKVPKKGTKEKLVELASDNAKLVLSKDKERMRREEGRTIGAVKEIEALLGISQIRRMEAYDISNTNGFESVGSMVVYERGKPKRNDYRKFKIKGIQGADDYGSMREVLTRRFTHGLKEREENGELGKFTVFPDLILMDGGKGQVSAVQNVLDQNNLQIPLWGMFKDDKHRTKGLVNKSQEIVLDRTTNLYRFVASIQEEVHNYAITYHRSLRKKSLTKSVLDDIPGIGEKRKKNLLSHFKNIESIKAATFEQLLEVESINKTAAENIYNYFKSEE